MRNILSILGGLSILLAAALAAVVGGTVKSPANFLGVQTVSMPTATVLVTEVVDGDTIKVQSGTETLGVRLIGIDTPETKHPTKPVQCFGEEASAKLKSLLSNKQIKLLADSTQDDQDRYGRLLRYVYLTDNTFVNKLMVEQGFAFEYTYAVPYQFQAEFKQAQNLARQNNLGLWGNICEYTSVQPTSFTCDCSKSCAQMNSCAEAQYQFATCGCKDRDGDGDGLACNSICR